MCTCDGFFSLPAEEKAISWTCCALAMGFSPSLSMKRQSHGTSPCLSRKRPSHGLGVRLRWTFPPARRSAGRGKGHIMDLVGICDGLSLFLSRNMACACESLFPVRSGDQGSLLVIRVSDPGGVRGLRRTFYLLFFARATLFPDRQRKKGKAYKMPAAILGTSSKLQFG